MAIIQYGKTWWGQQWLQALAKIDNSNRLPRGKTYANKGSVKSIDIKGNKIEAKVQGSMPKPYKITITVPAFSTSQKNSLIDEIQDNPGLLATLLNRELPADLNEFAQKNGISIFPKSWKDFNMDCSCPDYAVPCKHLAAVIYIVANEIDKNPFLVFQLHDFDLFEILSSQNKGMQKASVVATLQTADLCIANPTKITLDETAFEQLDFTQIRPLSENLLKLLTPSPIFWEKDYKKNVTA